MAVKVKIIANAQAHEVEAGTPLDRFLQELGFIPQQVVVERNEEALTPQEAREVTLEEGDRLEIVEIVAGG